MDDYHFGLFFLFFLNSEKKKNSYYIDFYFLFFLRWVYFIIKKKAEMAEMAEWQNGRICRPLILALLVPTYQTNLPHQ